MTETRKRKKLVLPLDAAVELRYEDDFNNEPEEESEGEPYIVVERNNEGSGRWQTRHSIVFEHANEYYKWTYMLAATEYQDDENIESEGRRTAKQVFPEDTVVTVYK